MTAVLFITLFLIVVPLVTLGQEGNAMCVPSIPPCGCGKILKDNKCVGGTNKLGCSCQETENGFTASGICVVGSICKTTGTSDGKGPDQGMAKLGEILGKLMEALKGKDGGGGSPTSPTDQNCTTMSPTSDKQLAMTNPMCYYLDPNATDPNATDPSGGLVASPTEGPAPLTVYFAFTNGTVGCKTPTLVLDFGDGKTEQQQIHSETTCSGLSETTQHIYTTAGAYSARLKNASTDEVRGGVNLTVSEGDATPTPDDTATTAGTNTGGTNTNIQTNGNATNLGATQFTTPLTNLGTTGTVKTGTTGGSNSVTGSYSTGGSVSTGGSNFGNPGATLNFNTPQSIVQSIIQKNLPPGAYGDVKILENGTTIIAGVRDNNSEVVGFYGTNSKSGGVGAVSRLCTNRPWASNFLSYIIPPSFFDSLCTWRGYTPGTPQKAPVSTNPTTVGTKPATVKTTVGGKAATTTKPVVAPETAKVDIWASPLVVPLGARTSIFWSSQGVSECVETSPDGSFTHASLKGGASTVPLTADTTFTISCITPNGVHLTKDVVVKMAL